MFLEEEFRKNLLATDKEILQLKQVGIFHISTWAGIVSKIYYFFYLTFLLWNLLLKFISSKSFNKSLNVTNSILGNILNISVIENWLHT